MIKIFTEEEIFTYLSYAGVASRLDDALMSLANGSAAILGRRRVECESIKLSSMGAIWTKVSLCAEKTYTTVNGKFGFLISLFDTDTGEPVAVMPADVITRFRTAGLTSIVLARTVQTTNKLAVFGAGVQGKAHIEAIQGKLGFREIAIVDLNNQSELCEQLSQKYKIKVMQLTPDQAVENADAIVTTTRSRIPIFDGTRVKPGAVVAAVGTSLPVYRELDDCVLSRAGKVIVEWKPQCIEEAGEIVMAIGSGALKRDRIIDLQEIYRGDQTWRDSTEQIVVFKSVGIGLSDLAAATEVWQQFIVQKP